MFKYYSLLLTLALGLQAADASWYGTWKMDASKSHFENIPTFKSFTLVIQKEGENDVLDFSVVTAEGKASKMRFAQPHEGGKVTIGGVPPSDAYDDLIVTVPDDHHWIYAYRKLGKTAFERYVTLSADGRTHEAKMTRKLPDGKTFVENECMVRQ